MGHGQLLTGSTVADRTASRPLPRTSPTSSQTAPGRATTSCRSPPTSASGAALTHLAASATGPAHGGGGARIVRCADALTVVEAVGEQPPGPAADAVGLLALVAGQDVELVDDGEQGPRWRTAQRVAKDRVISTVDPEARHAHKTVPRRQDGFKAHVAVEPDTGLVTDCAAVPALPGATIESEGRHALASSDQTGPLGGVRCRCGRGATVADMRSLGCRARPATPAAHHAALARDFHRAPLRAPCR